MLHFTFLIILILIVIHIVRRVMDDVRWISLVGILSWLVDCQGDDFMVKYSANQAIRICERRLKPNYRVVGVYDCYYHDGRCELGFNCEKCYDYRNDVSFTNLVREKILKDPQWCVHNWERLCKVDKDLFVAIYRWTKWGNLVFLVIILRKGDYIKMVEKAFSQV